MTNPARSSTLDRVLVLDHGRIVREGPFSVLRDDPMCRNLLHETPMTTGA
jgi:ABC-type multidrug transport system fused ATPase/permease subunit